MHDLAKRGADPGDAIGKVDFVVPPDPGIAESKGTVIGMGRGADGRYWMVLGSRAERTPRRDR